MTSPIRRVLDAGNLFGLNFVQTARCVRGIPKFLQDYRAYRKQGPPVSFRPSVGQLMPMLTDYRGSAGAATGHYFHQDLWAARRIFRRRPARHIDIGSRIDGFIAHLLVFMDVQVIDILPLDSKVPGLYFHQDDATSLASLRDNSVVSISSLHVAEHFGLGRYSDPVDPWAHVKFMNSLERVLAPGGSLYFSVPIGRERVEFNAHRVFDPETILTQFKGLRLSSFSYVDDRGALHEDRSPADVPGNTSHGCGLFDFTKE
jgi:SAM-dependent methyltransferase